MSELTRLGPDDARPMWPWIRQHLRQHLRWWSDAHGLTWDDATIERRIDAGRLIHREWGQLLAGADGDFVRVARVDDKPVAVVYAELRRDVYLDRQIGVLSWIYVSAEARGVGLGKWLLSAASDWMRSNGATSVELYVTAPNETAVAMYERWGLAVIDHRMVGPLPPKSE